MYVQGRMGLGKSGPTASHVANEETEAQRREGRWLRPARAEVERESWALGVGEGQVCPWRLGIRVYPSVC